jgi:hypothetical protein
MNRAMSLNVKEAQLSLLEGCRLESCLALRAWPGIAGRLKFCSPKESFRSRLYAT